jgi:hypothetical protein
MTERIGKGFSQIVRRDPAVTPAKHRSNIAREHFSGLVEFQHDCPGRTEVGGSLPRPRGGLPAYWAGLLSRNCEGNCDLE